MVSGYQQAALEDVVGAQKHHGGERRAARISSNGVAEEEKTQEMNVRRQKMAEISPEMAAAYST